MLSAPARSVLTWSPGGCIHKSAKSRNHSSTAAAPQKDKNTQSCTKLWYWLIFLTGHTTSCCCQFTFSFLQDINVALRKSVFLSQCSCIIKHQGKGQRQSWARRLTCLLSTSKRNTVKSSWINCN